MPANNLRQSQRCLINCHQVGVVQDCVHANSIWTQEAAQGRHAYRLDFDNLFSQAPESQVKSCDWNWSLGQNFLRRPQSSSTLPRYVSSFSSKASHNHSIGALRATCQWPRRWLRTADDFLASTFAVSRDCEGW